MTASVFHLPEHVLRSELSDEVHARPPARLEGTQQVVYLALRHGPDERATHQEFPSRLASRWGLRAHAVTDHVSLSLTPEIRYQWEGHAEFSSHTFFVAGGLAISPNEVLERAGWRDVVEGLSGEVLVAVRLDLMPFDGDAPPPAAFEPCGDAVVGGAIGDGRAWFYTDLRVRGDGFTHFLVLNRGMGAGQAGRMVQRLLEIETYRMMALLAFPTARTVSPELRELEAALEAVVERMAGAAHQDETRLLDDLTKLAARVEHLQSETRFRFEAADAYVSIVGQRLEQLRELRIPGLPTLAEFLNRRLTPAMDTCKSTARRISSLAERVSRASALLRTRVDVARERQNQFLLQAMNRRGRLQLRLQQAVEGLSVVVITYYGVSLVGIVAKAAKSLGVDLNAELVMASALPVVAAIVYFGVHRVRLALGSDESDGA